MTDTRIERSRKAQETLKEIVIEVLTESAKNSVPCLRASEISKRAEIFREGGHGEIASFNDAIVTGILMDLHREGRVERCYLTEKTRGWKLK